MAYQYNTMRTITNLESEQLDLKKKYSYKCGLV